MLLAASVPARAREHAVELGAGIGAAGLALAARVSGLRVTLLEIDPGLSELAAGNIARNDLADRLRALTLDVTAPAEAFVRAGLAAACADHVLMNPPFNDPARQNVSPDPLRREAHAGLPGLLAAWLRANAWLLRPAGTVTLIWRADGLPLVLEALQAGFGGVTILPVHGVARAPAIRILVRADRDSRAPLALLPGLILNGEDGRPTPEAEAVLRHAAALPLANP